MPIIAIVLLLVTAITIQSIHARTSVDSIQPGPDSTANETIVVTATRTVRHSRNIAGINYVIDSAAMRVTQPSSLSDILGYAQGIDVEAGTGVGSPGKKSISINGTPAFHNIVLVDGRRLLSSHYHTGIDVNLVPSHNLDRIEIIKDASGALYGSDAIGGVVNCITRSGSAKPSMAVTSSFGSQHTWNSTALLRGTAGSSAFSSFAGWEKSDGMPIETSRRAGKLNYEQFTLMERLDKHIGGRGEVAGFVHYVTQSDMRNPGDTLKYDARLFSPGLDFSARIRDSLTLAGKGYYTRWDADLSHEKNELATPQCWLVWSGTAKHTLLLGGETAWRNFARDGVAEKSQKSAALFMQDEISLVRNMIFLAAGRCDYVFNAAHGGETIGPIFTPKFSVLYRPVKKIALRLNSGLGFRAPNVQDLYESRSHSSGGGIWRHGNSLLKPEFSKSIGLGIEAGPVRRLTIVANGFTTSLTDMIAVVPAGRDTVYRTSKGALDTVPVMVRENIRSYTIQSFELGAQYSCKHISLELGGSASWQSSSDPEGKEALLFPGRNFRAKVSGPLPLTANVTLDPFIGLRSSFNRKSPAGAGLRDYKNLECGLDAQLFRKYRLYVKAENLLKEKIDLYEDALITIQGVRRYEGGIKAELF